MTKTEIMRQGNRQKIVINMAGISPYINNHFKYHRQHIPIKRQSLAGLGDVYLSSHNLGGTGRRITNPRLQDQPGQHNETSSQKRAKGLPSWANK